MAATALSLMVLTTFALLVGGVYLWSRGRHRRQAVLMLVLAAVIAVNIALWTLPASTGDALIDAVPSDAPSVDG